MICKVLASLTNTSVKYSERVWNFPENLNQLVTCINAEDAPCVVTTPFRWNGDTCLLDTLLRAGVSEDKLVYAFVCARQVTHKELPQESPMSTMDLTEEEIRPLRINMRVLQGWVKVLREKITEERLEFKGSSIRQGKRIRRWVKYGCTWEISTQEKRGPAKISIEGKPDRSMFVLDPRKYYRVKINMPCASIRFSSGESYEEFVARINKELPATDTGDMWNRTTPVVVTTHENIAELTDCMLELWEGLQKIPGVYILDSRGSVSIAVKNSVPVLSLMESLVSLILECFPNKPNLVHSLCVSNGEGKLWNDPKSANPLFCTFPELVTGLHFIPKDLRARLSVKSSNVGEDMKGLFEFAKHDSTHLRIILQLTEYLESISSSLRTKSKVCETCDNYMPILRKAGVPWTERRCHYCDGGDGWASIQEYIDQLKIGLSERSL